MMLSMDNAINRKWTVTMGAKTMIYEQDYNVPGGKVAPAGSTMAMPLEVFLAGLAKMRAAGAVVVEGSR